MGSRLHGATMAAGGRTQCRHCPRRESTATHIVIPAKAGIHGGGRPGDGSPSPRDSTMARRRGHVPQSSGRTHNGGNPRPPYRHSRGRRESMAGGRGDGFPSRHGRRRPPISSFPIGGNPAAAGGGDGFPSPRERRGSSFPARRRGAGGWVPVSTGTTAPTSSFPRRRESGGDGGHGDGFPSARERRWAV